MDSAGFEPAAPAYLVIRTRTLANLARAMLYQVELQARE